MISVAASFDTPSPSNTFLKPSTPPTVTPPASKGSFCPRETSNSVVRLGRIKGCWTDIANNVAYSGWVCHAGVTIWRRDWSFLFWQVPFLLRKMKGMITRKGFFKNSEGNLQHSSPDPYARTSIWVTDGLVGKKIDLFEVFLWFPQSKKIFWGWISNCSNLCDFWITNLPEYSDCLVSTLL